KQRVPRQPPLNVEIPRLYVGLRRVSVKYEQALPEVCQQASATTSRIAKAARKRIREQRVGSKTVVQARGCRGGTDETELWHGVVVSAVTPAVAVKDAVSA